jgi:hypothetical protein
MHGGTHRNGTSRFPADRTVAENVGRIVGLTAAIVRGGACLGVRVFEAFVWGDSSYRASRGRCRCFVHGGDGCGCRSRGH